MADTKDDVLDSIIFRELERHDNRQSGYGVENLVLRENPNPFENTDYATLASGLRRFISWSRFQSKQTLRCLDLSSVCVRDELALALADLLRSANLQVLKLWCGHQDKTLLNPLNIALPVSNV